MRATHFRILKTASCRISLFLVLGLAAALRAQGVPHSDTPPARFTRSWQSAIRLPGESREQALAQLGSHREWEPYFRSAYNLTTDQKLRDLLRPALIESQAELFAWNMERAKDWAKEYRFDYLTSLAIATDDPDAAAMIGDFIIVTQRKIHDRFKEIGKWGRLPPAKNLSFVNRQDFERFSQSKEFARFSGDHVTVPATGQSVMIHARAGVLTSAPAHRWICLSDQQLTENTQYGNQLWRYSVICVNGNATLRELSHSLVVCDGDIEFPGSEIVGGSGSASNSVIIANGNVTVDEDFMIGSHSFVYAAGDCRGRKDLHKGGSISILAGGKVASMPSPEHANAKYFKENVRENPFGVKFVSPSDVGCELAVGKKAVRLGKIAESSVLAKAGIEKGDLIRSLNGIAIETAADFRRQLRESLLWGTGLFEIRRDGHTFLRLVRLAEPIKRKKE